MLQTCVAGQSSLGSRLELDTAICRRCTMQAGGCKQKTASCTLDPFALVGCGHAHGNGLLSHQAARCQCQQRQHGRSRPVSALSKRSYFTSRRLKCGDTTRSFIRNPGRPSPPRLHANLFTGTDSAVVEQERPPLQTFIQHARFTTHVPVACLCRRPSPRAARRGLRSGPRRASSLVHTRLASDNCPRRHGQGRQGRWSGADTAGL